MSKIKSNVIFAIARFTLDRLKIGMKIAEVKIKSVLTKSGLPDADWVVNPYVGCAFGCKYCYAAFIGRWKHPGEVWGDFVDVKINAPEVLRGELEKLSKKFKNKNFGSIFFSSVTDPCQGVEGKYQITRQCLQVLADFGYEGEISILTKSPLVCRDIAILSGFKNVSIGLTVTSLDDEVSRFLESNAPAASLRIMALRELHNAGIATYVFIGPLLPYFTARIDKLEAIFNEIKIAGVVNAYVEHINLSPKIRERLFSYLSKTSELIPYFEKARTGEYLKNLEKEIYSIAEKYGVKIIGGKVMSHG